MAHRITIKYGIPDRDGLPGTDNTGWPWAEWEVDPRRAFARLWDLVNGGNPVEGQSLGASHRVASVVGHLVEGSVSSSVQYTRGALALRDLPPKQERVDALRRFIEARWYGVNRKQLLDEFGEWYGDAAKHTLGERRFYRDLATLPRTIVRAAGRWVRAERVKFLPDAPDEPRQRGAA